MRNVLILGSGRSGTSMVAGTLAGAGWFVGSRPYAPRSSNPKGFFESPDVNGTNELLLSEVAPASEGLRAWQRWLAWLPEGVECRSSPRVERMLRRLVARTPWCYKDPRLAYTLPVWRPHLGNAGLLCIFRDPAVTARSILKECGQEPYLASLAMDMDRALWAWDALYRRILDHHRHQGEWLFLHYEQVLTPAGQRRIEDFVGAPISRDFPEENLRRTRTDEPVPEAVARTYEELCGLAGHAAAARPRSVAPEPRLARSHRVIERALAQLVARRHPLPPAARSARDLAGFEAAVRSASPFDGPGLALDREYVEGRLPTVALWERVVRELGTLDLGPLESLDATPAIEALVRQVADALRELAELYVREERIARAEAALAQPWDIRTRATARVLAWPQWNADALERLLAQHRTLWGTSGGPALCLRHDGDIDVDVESALAALESAYARVFPDGEELEVTLLSEPIAPEELGRVGRAIDAAFDAQAGSDSVRLAWLVATGAPLAGSPAELARVLPLNAR